MVNMHSDAYIEFIERINTDGYKQGYDETLFDQIFPNEIDDIEKIIEEEFDKGDLEMSVFMPKLRRCNGIKKLQERTQELNNYCYAYCNIMSVLYTATKKEIYLDNIIAVLKNEDEAVRMDAVFCLMKCGRSRRLYEVYRQQCLTDDEEDIRLRCVDGMYYCQSIIDSPFTIQKLEEPWNQLKLKMFDCDRSKEERYQALLEFENKVKM